MNSQKGFIQIPILIAIIVGLFVVGGTGYLAYKTGKSSQNASTQPTVATSSTNIQTQPTTTAESSTPSRQVEVKKESAPKYTPPAVTSAPPATTNVALNYCNGKSYNPCSYPKIFSCPKSGEGQCIDPSTDIYCATDGAYYKRTICPADQFLNCPTDGGQIRCVDTNKTAYCNGAYYNQCTSGYFVCPSVGKATCAVDYSPQILESLNNSLQAYLQQQEKERQFIQQQSQQLQATLKPCEDWLKQVNTNVVTIKAEISAAGGYGSESQVMEMAIKRAGNPPAQCGSSGSSYTSSYSSTHCNYLNGGLDCTSSNGTRTQATPIPGGGGFDISSW